MTEYNVAVVGATGVVGKEMLNVLGERNFPVGKLKLLASSRSAGSKISFQGREYTVEETRPESFKDVHIALFSSSEAASGVFAKEAVQHKSVVIDNSSTFRQDPEVPLVVPEINPEDLKKHKGIIANPNCSTIQMVVVLKPLHDAANIKRIVVSTYQSVSGWGREAIQQLWMESREIIQRNSEQMADIRCEISDETVLNHQIAFNVIPHIDKFMPNSYTKEEMKMVNETRRIMHDENIAVTATCVRVPVFRGHAESVNIETEKKLTVDEVKSMLSCSPGVEVYDDPKRCIYPMPLYAMGKEAVFVGRIREDNTIKNGLNLWIVSDNLLKGAALNAIQIAEQLIKDKLVR